MQDSASRYAFSLVEISLILVIFGGIAGMSISLGTKWAAKEEVVATRKLMRVIDEALDVYRKVNGRLPCPASLTLTPSDPNYGLEAYEPLITGPAELTGECIDSTGGAGVINATPAGAGTGVSFGAVPAKTLGLSDGLMRDQWGNLFVYYVTDRATMEGSFWGFPRHTNYIDMYQKSVGNIRVNDAQGNARTVSAIYALVSHGQDEHGAYNTSGTRLGDGSNATASELENCDCEADLTPRALNQVLVSRFIEGNEDDIVTYKERHHLFDAKVRSLEAECAGGDERLQVSNRCYARFSSTPLNWGDAETACQAWGGNLVTIGDASENTLIYDSELMETPAPFVEYWIGLNEIANPGAGAYEWSSGETVGYLNWDGDSGDPHSAGENCAVIADGTVGPTYDGTWADSDCTTTKAYICERGF